MIGAARVRILPAHAMPAQRRIQPVSVEIVVAWGDMDAFQHVNNTVYLRWFETARIAYFERIGVMGAKQAETGIGPILAHATVDYRRPVTYPDRVRVGVNVSAFGTRSFTMSYQVWSEAQQALVATGQTVIVMFDYRGGRAVPVDEELRGAIAAVEGARPGEA